LSLEAALEKQHYSSQIIYYKIMGVFNLFRESRLKSSSIDEALSTQLFNIILKLQNNRHANIDDEKKY
jgi:hypothetical protein